MQMCEGTTVQVFPQQQVQAEDDEQVRKPWIAMQGGAVPPCAHTCSSANPSGNM